MERSLRRLGCVVLLIAPIVILILYLWYVATRP